jgi:hypothetical protein
MDTEALPKSELTQKRWNAATARKILEEFAASGMSRAAFARARGVKAHRLKWWQERLGDRRAPAKVAFIPATISSIGSLVIRLPTGMTIEAPSATALPPAWLAELSRALVVRP